MSAQDPMATRDFVVEAVAAVATLAAVIWAVVSARASQKDAKAARSETTRLSTALLEIERERDYRALADRHAKDVRVMVRQVETEPQPVYDSSGAQVDFVGELFWEVVVDDQSGKRLTPRSVEIRRQVGNDEWEVVPDVRPNRDPRGLRFPFEVSPGIEDLLVVVEFEDADGNLWRADSAGGLALLKRRRLVD